MNNLPKNSYSCWYWNWSNVICAPAWQPQKSDQISNIDKLDNLLCMTRKCRYGSLMQTVALNQIYVYNIKLILRHTHTHTHTEHSTAMSKQGEQVFSIEFKINIAHFLFFCHYRFNLKSQMKNKTGANSRASKWKKRKEWEREERIARRIIL